jgi:hypothetical protein
VLFSVVTVCWLVWGCVLCGGVTPQLMKRHVFRVVLTLSVLPRCSYTGAAHPVAPSLLDVPVFPTIKPLHE